MKEDKDSWNNFLSELKGQGLRGFQLIIGDKNLDMLESIPEVFPEAKYLRCTVHFYRNILSITPRSRMKFVAKMLKRYMLKKVRMLPMKRRNRSLMNCET